MKTKFFELVKEVKEAGIAVALCNASNADEIMAAWQKFKEEKSELFAKITDWAAEFAGSDDCGAIFEDGAEVENPIEVAVCIYIMGADVTECEIFDSNSDFVEALCDTGEKNAEQIGNFVSENYLYSIEAEDIFSEEESDDGEDATEEDTAEAEDSDDGEETEIVSEDADADESYGADESESGINLAEAEDH